jgi:hypothetical protein
MGYVMVSNRGDTNPELVRNLPNLKGKMHELRQWSVRTSLSYTLTPPALKSPTNTRIHPVEKDSIPVGDVRDPDVQNYLKDRDLNGVDIEDGFGWDNWDCANCFADGWGFCP